MKTIRYVNQWPWGVDIVHICDDGLGTIGVSKEPDYFFCLIHDLFVHEKAQKQGRGQRLLELAEWEIKHTHKRNFALLRVVPGSWMEQWYKRNGYKHTGKPATEYGYIDLIKQL